MFGQLMDRERNCQSTLEVLEETARICVRSIPEMIDFWLRPGAAVEHVKDGKADNQSGLTYAMAGVIEGMKILGYCGIISYAARTISS
jgi:hypothetical protein